MVDSSQAGVSSSGASAASVTSQRRVGVIVVGAGPTGRGVVERVAGVMPVTLVDKEIDYEDLPVELRNGRFLRGDATSALVLREAGVSRAYGVVAATSEDDVNLEVCRLAVAAGVPEVICRLTDADRTAEATALGARAVTAPVAMSGALTARLPGLVVTTSEVGLGRGDILQVRVMPGSPVVGRSIMDLATREYLVAAIYRGGELVVPHGDTVIGADDHVLLTGPPDTLRAVAAHYRIGRAQFPRQFGRAVVAWDPEQRLNVLHEARWIREAGEEPEFIQVLPVGSEAQEDGDSIALPLLPHRARAGRVPIEAFALINDHHPGLWVLPGAGRSFLREEGMGPLRSLMDNVEPPLLLSRATFPYDRILVAVGESPSSWAGLELAVDIARLLDAPITAVHVSPPEFIGGASARQSARRVEERVRELCRHLELEGRVLLQEGNPIRQVEQLTEEHDLLVVARRRGQTDGYFSPDVGLRMALQARCSALLLTRND